ncbi:33650_t:CDS:2 [Gigaspora margarita]|uniref:33650_t:CDS:1 n=1 Tax=Gigaspora margarita TaxID=4874 RepID=A0ABN7U3R7_GIGMA|nr:33650_t:CDS:2 [Gigaspora margarita]
MKETAQEIIERINKEKREKRIKAKPEPTLLGINAPPPKQKKQPEKIIAENKPSTLLTGIEEKLENIHCKECNKPIPKHLLRGMFYKIIVDSKAFFKLLITGKNNRARQIKERKKNVRRNNRGDEATGNGVCFRKKLRIRFCSLQQFQETDSSFGRNAIHLVFDEAMPSNEKSFNPDNEEKEHLFEGFKEVEDKKKGAAKQVPILLYQCPEREDENSFILDLIEDNPYRHKQGLFEKKEEMFISERPQMFYDGKEIYPFEPKMIIKECIYAKLKRNDQKFYFFRKAKEEEVNIPEDIVHFCSTSQKYHESTYSNKMLVEGEELKK